MSQTLVSAAPSPFAMLHVPVGSLDSYIQAVNRIPLLSSAEEMHLACRFRHDGDRDAAHRLIASHLRMAVSTARNFTGYGLPQADLIQEGNIGLMKAVKRFDPDRGVRLASYAIHWIKAEMQEFIIRNWRMVKIATSKAQRKLFFNLRSMTPARESLDQAETTGLAQALHVKPEDVAEMERRFTGRERALDTGNDADDIHAPVSYLVDPRAEPLETLEAEQEKLVRAKWLVKALDSLDARSRRIVGSRWLRESDSARLIDLAAEFRISAERVRQIETEAFKKMKCEPIPV